MPVFRAAEMMEIALQKEKRRRDFYRAAAQRFSEPRLRDLFTRLQQWEEAHVERLQQLSGQLEDFSVHESYPGEYRAYVDTLLDERIYDKTSVAQIQEEIGAPREAIDRGIGFEKDSILFFQELAQFVGSSGQRTIDQLIREEKHHVAQLVSLRSEYAA
jgi:rubrerythrin